MTRERDCLKCGKPIIGRRPDALYCSKSCSASAANARYWKTQRAKEVRERWLESEEGRASREGYLRSKKFIRGTARRMREWRARHPEKWEAHKAVSRAVASEELVRPDYCESCGNDGLRLEAHHDDYSLPLSVRWLCRPCHRTHHGRSKREVRLDASTD